MVRRLLFQLEPEVAHDLAITLLGFADRLLPPSRPPAPTGLRQKVFGIDFANPIGLAAGFDKNARLPHVWSRFGFGFAELGTVTARPQPGNPKPRIFRLAEQRALINRLGFNNQGATAVAERLAAALASRPPIPIGINLGKSKVTPIAEANGDYCESYRRLAPLADYVTINVSSPNTPGLRSLQNTAALAGIIDALRAVDLEAPAPPLLVKVAPDLADEDLRDIAELAVERSIDGLIATNTTLERSFLPADARHRDEAGGLSGAPLRQRSTEVIGKLFAHCGERIPIVGVGGIFSGADAFEKILAGARLVQMYTGFIYGGPSSPRHVVEDLARQLELAGFGHLGEAVGRRAG